MEEKQEIKLFNMDLEQTILGVLILNNKYYDLIEENIKEKYFFYLEHRKIYNFIKQNIENKKEINGIILNNYIDSIEKNYLKVLINMGTAIIDIKPYLEELKNLYSKREIKRIMEVCNNAINSEKNSNEILENINNDLENLENEATDYNYEVKNVEEILAERIFNIEENIKNNRLNNYLKTNLIDFDLKFTGIPRKQLTIIGGRSSMGKSTFALQIAKNISENYNVLFFSEEMGFNENADKILANINKINSINIRDSKLTQEEINKIKSNCNNNKSKNLYIVEKQGIDSNYIKKTLKRFERKVGKVDLIIVDHLQMTRDSNKSRSRIEELGNITLDFKEIAKEYNCGFILLSQLSRNVEMKTSPRPELSDLRESGRIEENADLIMFVYRAEYYIERDLQGLDKNSNKYKSLEEELKKYKNKAEIMVKKYRNGACGSIILKFYPEYSLFDNLKGDENGSY